MTSCTSLAELEEFARVQLEARGFDLRTPTPIRVQIESGQIGIHVIAGSCPIANPEGPSPWRYEGPVDRGELVGVFVVGGPDAGPTIRA